MNKLEITQEQVTSRVNKSRSHITNMIGLLSLPEIVKQKIANNEITMGHARVLSKLEDNEKINSLAEKIIRENLSVRDLEELTNKEEYPRKNKITVKEKSNEF